VNSSHSNSNAYAKPVRDTAGLRPVRVSREYWKSFSYKASITGRRPVSRCTVSHPKDSTPKFSLLSLFFASSFAPSRLRVGILIFFVMTLMLAGCDNSTATQTRPTVPAGACMIRGGVRFVGTSPEPQTIGGNCCPGATAVLDESLAVNPDGSMKNIVVYIQNGPNVDVGQLPERVLAQKNCQYVPHVLAVQTNQTVVVTNHDPTLHNVLTQSDANPQQNIEEMQGAAHSFTFAHPELIKFKCSVHPWMTGYVDVFDHPCFAVTGDDGKFEIGHLPPGTYTLVIWQEKLGTQQMQVNVAADKPTEVKFEYRGN
jgi:plastocyanin